MQKVILAIVALVVGLLLIVWVFVPTTEDAMTEAYSEPFDVTTGPGVTNATETLSYEHFPGDLTDLTADSDNDDDNPVVMRYDEDTYDVLVAGLQASDSRILTINYVRPKGQEFVGVTGFYRMMPFLLVVGLFAAGLWGIFSAVKNRG
jgi:hypothetical protein